MIRTVGLIQILFGAAIMLLSIVVALDIRKKAPTHLRAKWLVIIAFAVLFFLGYLFVIFIPLFGLPFPLEILIGSVFLAGAVFVYFVVRVTGITLSHHNEKEKGIMTLSETMAATNAALREINESLEKEISERIHSEDALRKSEEKYRSLVESTDDSIYVIGSDYRYQFINKKHRARLGITDSDYMEKSYGDFHSPEVTMGFKKIVEKVFATGESTRLEHRSERDQEHYLLTVSPVRESDGAISAVTVVSKRVTELKRLEEELRELTLTDELTGLYNRRGFFTLSGQQIRMANRHKNKVFILYADLDNLKVINDAIGHQEGDLVLTEAARILKESFRDSDIIARIGGDEFVVMPIGTTELEAKITIERLYRNLEIANRERKAKYSLSLSVGIAYYDPEQPCSIAELLAWGDRAMYENKKDKKSH